MRKRLFVILGVCMLVLLNILPVAAQTNPRLVDDAQLLSEDERAELTEYLDEISERQEFDVVIATVNSLDGKSSESYADDFFDYNGYGIGESRDGILLLISMENRDWAISTRGFGITAFTDAGQEYMVEDFLTYLSDGDYMFAFTCFADLCDDFITQAKTGEPYDVGNMPKMAFPFLLVPVNLGIGCLLALIPAFIKKGKLKTVRENNAASDYVKKESLVLTEKQDIYIRTNVIRRKIETDSGSSGGGSSTHTGSSGATHGGSSGKF